MKNTFGNAITLTLFGESHGTAIGCVLDGLAPGMDVSEECIGEKMALRRPQGAVSTARREPDPVHVVS
ncbi:MAG: chorismate synthase, partial [Clostridia bacterium]|nr:chorismate synthase [Clostridia bacterium]